MNTGTVLAFSGLSIGALLASLVVVRLLNRQLRGVLGDLCGSGHRAEFWASVSGLWIVLTGMLAGTWATGYVDGNGGPDLFDGVTDQLRLLLAGLLVAVLVVAALVLKAIDRQNRSRPAWRANIQAPPTEGEIPGQS